MTKAFRFLLARLSEVSTWKGLFLILTAAGVTIRPDMQAAILSLGLTLTGILGAATPDPVPSAPEGE